MAKNKQWIYARKPEGAVTAGHFDLAEADKPQPGEGAVRHRSLFTRTFQTDALEG